jgi:GT2 family glycosyltransferase
LLAFHAAHRSAPDAMLGGYTRNALPRNPFATTSQLLIDYLYGYYNDALNDGRMFTSNNMAVSRDRFVEEGGFDPLFTGAAGEDRDLSARWRHRGWGLHYTPEAVVAHAHPLTLRTFVRQHFRYGRAAYYYRVREAGRSAEGVRLEPAAFYTDMVRLPFHRGRTLEGARNAALLVVSQAGNAAGYLWEKIVAEDRLDDPPPSLAPDAEPVSSNGRGV